jgi:hypothetical protein
MCICAYFGVFVDFANMIFEFGDLNLEFGLLPTFAEHLSPPSIRAV